MTILPLLEASVKAIHFSMAESHFLGTSLILVGCFRKGLLVSDEDELNTSTASNFCRIKNAINKKKSSNNWTNQSRIYHKTNKAYCYGPTKAKISEKGQNEGNRPLKGLLLRKYQNVPRAYDSLDPALEITGQPRQPFNK